MKTPKEWVLILGDRVNDLTESDIKAIQDEVLKAGMNHAAEIAGKLFSGSNAKLEIVTEMDKLQ